MVRSLILKLANFLKNRKVGQKENEQKIIVVGENNTVIIINNK